MPPMFSKRIKPVFWASKNCFLGTIPHFPLINSTFMVPQLVAAKRVSCSVLDLQECQSTVRRIAPASDGEHSTGLGVLFVLCTAWFLQEVQVSF